MPNKHQGWRLYSRSVDVNPRVEKTVYFFSDEAPADGKPADPPIGYRIAIRPETGLPILERLEASDTQ